MGPQEKKLMFRSCPVGTLLSDSVVPLLKAYNMYREFEEWPPGRRDPRVVEAFLVIRREQQLILNKK